MASGKEEKEVIWNASEHVKPGQRKMRRRIWRHGKFSLELQLSVKQSIVPGSTGGPGSNLATLEARARVRTSAWRSPLFLEALVVLARRRGVFSVGAAEGEQGHTRLHPLLTRYTHRGRTRLYQERWPARTSVSRSSRECYAVLSDGPESTESLHSDGPYARTKLALEFEPQRGEVRCSWKRWWSWLGDVEFSAWVPLKENKATRVSTPCSLATRTVVGLVCTRSAGQHEHRSAAVPESAAPCSATDRRAPRAYTLMDHTPELHHPGYMKSVLSSGRCSVSVWGAISRRGLGPLVRIDGSFTAAYYTSLIQYTLVPCVLDGPFPDGLYLFQQDRSPVHMAHRVTAALENLAVPTLQWPPNGADMNPIENVWGLIKLRLSKRKLSRATADALWAAISEEWELLRARPEIVAALYDSMPRRVAEVISVNGNFTHY
ncbi:hypothetical protein HPB50_025523 [Hyalomma asiaticum]|uniref:Uncharacterized protein n=1 Tax=Hyalomma asiaticum TaxID=266040 RepID=A0ACB7SVC3_HYAAI|nr:hypothetical protein HPB50_025523 [Hyalomma asiaticum]